MSQLRKATRQKAKIRLGLSAVSGGGKTFSALLIASGLCGDWLKIAIIDTENNSADLYAHLGDYNVLPLSAPYTPEKYTAAIKECEGAGMEVIIIDSITHEWDGKGGILDIHGKMTGNSFTNWSSLTPRHTSFIESILQSPCHVITSVRRKQDYELSKDDKGKVVPQKVGLKEVTREGFEYELTANLELDTNHNATVSKDRTGLFAGQPAFVPSFETGKMLKAWCESGAAPILAADMREVLSITHPKWSDVIGALRGGYTMAQVELKYIVSSELKETIQNVLNPVQPTINIPAGNSNTFIDNKGLGVVENGTIKPF